MNTLRNKIAIISTLMVFTACSHLDLDLAPVSSIADGNYWKSAEQFSSFMTGIHSRFRGHSYNFFVLGNLRADEFGDVGSGPSLRSNTEIFWLNSMTPIQPGIGNFGEFYTNINQLNLFISKTEATGILNEATKNYLLGQAYGMRAYYYFHLVRSWGDVVVAKEPSVSFDINNLGRAATRSDEVISFIKEDIATSLNYFKDNYSFRSGKRSYWSKAASLMLQAEVFLWSARQLNGGTADATIAKSAILEIQDKFPSIRLLSNYKDVFSYSNKLNEEVIYAAYSQLDEGAPLGALWSFLPQSVTNYYDSLANRPMNNLDYVTNGGGGGFYVPITRASFRKFSNDDTRKFEAIQGMWDFDNNTYTLAGCNINKYKGVFVGGARQLLDDFIVYRYADALLLLAEAKAILGENIAPEINQVRKRAYGTGYDEAVHGYPNKNGDNDINETILNERFFELIGEGKRWYDLRRFGKEYVFKHTTAKQDFQLLMPIDVGALINNRDLVQNPGYTQ